MRKRWRGLVVPAAVALAACAGELDAPERFVVDDAQLPPGADATPGAEAGSPCNVVSLLQQRCATAGCHDATSKAAGLALAGANPLGTLANRPATGGGILLVPGQPEKSVLYLKTTPQPPFGARMPIGLALDAESIQCLFDAIAANR